MIEGWREKATTDVDQINKWWGEWPDANIGHPVPADTVVLDIDGADGEASLHFGGYPIGDPWCASKTGLGRHLWFRLPDGTTSRNRAAILPGVDTRGDGGFVVLPPSIHPSGGSYTWVFPPAPGHDHSDPDGSDAWAPPWLREAMEKSTGASDVPGSVPLVGEKKVEPGRTLAGIPEGQRDQELFRYACSLRARGVDYEEARVLLREAAANCSPPFSDEETQAKLSQAWKYSPKQVPPKFFFRKEVESAHVVSVNDLLSKEIPPVDWLAHDILPPGLAMLAGAPKGGKSFLAGNAAIAVSRGASFLGAFKCQTGNTLYLDLEQTERRAARRWQLMAQGQKIDGLNTVWRWPAWKEGLEKLDDYINKDKNLRLIIIDVMQVFMEGESSSGGNAYKADYQDMMMFRDLAHLYYDRGLCIMLVHHTNKAAMFQSDAFLENPLAGISGSVGISGACDTVWVLTRAGASTDGQLFVTGKETGDWKLPLKWMSKFGVWGLKDPTRMMSQVPL